MTTLLLFAVFSAFAAPSSEVFAAMAKTRSHGVHSVVAIPVLNDGFVLTNTWNYRLNDCGDRTTLSVGIAKLDSSTIQMTFVVATILPIHGIETALTMGDENLDGSIDTVAEDDLPLAVAQPIFDSIVHCVAAAP